MKNFEHIHLPWTDWKIVKYLGGGAYGKVYEIERNNSGIQEKAAVKIVSRPKEESELEVDYQNGYDRESIAVKYTEILQEYKNEYKLMKELQGQSNIVSCDDFAIEENPDGIGGKIYIRMELLTPLQKVTKERLLSEREVIKLGKDICKALILCESGNIIHRDIKPDNIMISKFGDYKLGDFGVSKVMSHTTGATMTGTEGYMAPEVLHMEKYGKEVDIYSLGIVMYWLLNNRRMPFIGADENVILVNANQAARRRYQGEKIPAPKNGSDELKRIVLKACEYKSKDRYLTAQEMYDALDEIGSGKTYTKNPVYGHPTESFPNPVHGHPAGSALKDDRLTSGKTGRKTGCGFSGRQTMGNSWDENPDTIGGLDRKKVLDLREANEQKDLHVTIQVKAKELGKSKIITIEYPNGTNRMFEVEIPANEVNGKTICLRGQGYTSEGDLILHLAIEKSDDLVFTEEDKKKIIPQAYEKQKKKVIAGGKSGIVAVKEAYKKQKKKVEDKKEVTVEKSDDKSKIAKYKWGKVLAVVAVCICGVLLVKNVLWKDGAWDTIVDYSNYKEDTDDNGNVIQRTYYYGNGKVGLIEEYDENENLTKETDYDTDGKVSSYRTCEYDEKGNQIKETNYDKNDKVSSYCTYEDDENGKMTKETDYDTDGKVSSSRTYEYDEKGNLIKLTNYDENDKMSSYRTYEYDEEGNRIKDTDYDENNNVTDVYEREYDENGNQVKWTEYDSEGQIVEYCVYEYNSDNEYKKDTTYDSEGNVISYTIYGKAGKGKWQKCTTYDADGKSTSHGWVRTGIN